MTWADAEAYAVSQEGHLATVRSSEEQAWIKYDVFLWRVRYTPALEWSKRCGGRRSIRVV